MLKLFAILKDIKKVIPLIAVALGMGYLLSYKILDLGIVNNNSALAMLLIFLALFFGGTVLLAVISGFSRVDKKNRGTIDGSDNEIELDSGNSNRGSIKKINELKISGKGNSVKMDVDNRK